jgi:hypothetical protein
MQYATSIAAIAVTAVLWMAGASAQIMDYAKYPNWKGQWVSVPNGGPPRYDPSKPPGRGQEAPLKPEYAAMHEASLKDQAEGGQGLDIGHKCIPSGVPRQMSGILPFEFVFTPDATYILFHLMTQQTRRIYTDGRAGLRRAAADLHRLFARQMARHRQRWSLRHFGGRDPCAKGTAPFRPDRHPDGRRRMTVVKERFFLDKENPNILYAEMTTIDNALMRPWTVMKSYRRLPTVIWLEDNCTEGNNHVAIGDRIISSAETVI